MSDNCCLYSAAAQWGKYFVGFKVTHIGSYSGFVGHKPPLQH